MKTISYYFVLTLLVYLFSCSNEEVAEKIEIDKDGKTMCASVDECLAVYDFERARKFIGKDQSYGSFSKDEDIKKITIAESKFWADRGEIDKALTVIDETWGIRDFVWSESDWQSWRYLIIDKGVTSSCEKGNYSQAKIYALKAADDLNADGHKIGETGWKDANHVIHNGEKAKGPSMRELLLKKISQFEELLKQ